MLFKLDDVKQICQKISLENFEMPDEILYEDIYCIIYRCDLIKCDNMVLTYRHIDIEYSFGEFYEICEDTSLFRYINTLYNLLLLKENKEIVLYQKE